MDYKIEYHKSVEKYLDSQPASTKERILNAIGKLPKGDVTKLKGREGYRLTIGGFRVLFRYSDNTTIDVVSVDPRGDVYKK